jgi:hypothetical protein
MQRGCKVKNLFSCILLIVSSVFLAGCPQDSDEPVASLKIKNESSWTISDIKWQNQSVDPVSLAPGSLGTLGLSEGASGYIFFKKVFSSSGGENSSLECRTQDIVAVEAGENGEFVFIDNTVVVEITDTVNAQPLGTMARIPAILTIKNQSFSDLLDVKWQGVTFRANPVENSIPIGYAVQRDVIPGSGYIFFRRQVNAAFARTKEVITLSVKQETKEFVFTDNTLIVEANNPDNRGALKDMPTTVVFFDDAEGDIQGYAERIGCAYYAEMTDLPYDEASRDDKFYFHPPYTGKSIALGGRSGAKLRLSLNLERKATLSFWYANMDYNTTRAWFTIDGTEKAAWNGRYEWAKLEYTLEAGPHDIVWTKNGYYHSSYPSSYYYSYLSLDNILVVYTE